MYSWEHTWNLLPRLQRIHVCKSTSMHLHCTEPGYYKYTEIWMLVNPHWQRRKNCWKTLLIVLIRECPKSMMTWTHSVLRCITMWQHTKSYWSWIHKTRSSNWVNPTTVTTEISTRVKPHQSKMKRWKLIQHCATAHHCIHCISSTIWVLYTCIWRSTQWLSCISVRASSILMYSHDQFIIRAWEKYSPITQVSEGLRCCTTMVSVWCNQTRSERSDVSRVRVQGWARTHSCGSSWVWHVWNTITMWLLPSHEDRHIRCITQGHIALRMKSKKTRKTQPDGCPDVSCCLRSSHLRSLDLTHRWP